MMGSGIIGDDQNGVIQDSPQQVLTQPAGGPTEAPSGQSATIGGGGQTGLSAGMGGGGSRSGSDFTDLGKYLDANKAAVDRQRSQIIGDSKTRAGEEAQRISQNIQNVYNQGSQAIQGGEATTTEQSYNPEADIRKMEASNKLMMENPNYLYDTYGKASPSMSFGENLLDKSLLTKAGTGQEAQSQYDEVAQGMRTGVQEQAKGLYDDFLSEYLTSARTEGQAALAPKLSDIQQASESAQAISDYATANYDPNVINQYILDAGQNLYSDDTMKLLGYSQNLAGNEGFQGNTLAGLQDMGLDISQLYTPTTTTGAIGDEYIDFTAFDEEEGAALRNLANIAGETYDPSGATASYKDLINTDYALNTAYLDDFIKSLSTDYTAPVDIGVSIGDLGTLDPVDFNDPLTNPNVTTNTTPDTTVTTNPTGSGDAVIETTPDSTTTSDEVIEDTGDAFTTGLKDFFRRLGI